MIKTLLKILPLLLLFCSSITKAQDFINENSFFECDQAFEINLPLNIKNNQTVFYQYEEQFSFWYKFKSVTSQTINFELTALDSNDSYTVFVYKNGNGSFCEKVFNGKIKPLKDQLVNKITSNAGLLTQFSLDPNPNKEYYFCILNTSATNCGHQLRLNSISDSIKVKAVHIPCSISDIDSATTKNTFNTTSKSLNTLIVLKDQVDSNKQVKAEILFKDMLQNTEVKIDYDEIKTNRLKIEKGKNYKVSCTAPGYQRFEHNIVISDYLPTDSSSFIIYLKPLKAGDIFLMNHIYFHPNTYALKSAANKELDYLVNFLNNNATLKIELTGHTNGNNKIKRNKAYKKRNAQWNFEGTSKKLSVYRSEEIKRKLIKKGIDPGRIFTKGVGGDKMLINDAKTLEAIEKNVRVEVKIL